MIQDAADLINDRKEDVVNKDVEQLLHSVNNKKKMAKSVGRKAKGPMKVLMYIREEKCKRKQSVLEQDRTELARICQMLIDELNECEGRIKAAEAIIGDFSRSGDDFNYSSNNNLIEILKRNQRTKDCLLQEIETLQDKSTNLDSQNLKYDREVEKLETFINSENGLNQKKVADLEKELTIDEENVVHLLQVIEELKARVEYEEANNIQKDIELNKKSEDVHDLSIKNYCRRHGSKAH